MKCAAETSAICQLSCRRCAEVARDAVEVVVKTDGSSSGLSPIWSRDYRVPRRAALVFMRVDYHRRSKAATSIVGCKPGSSLGTTPRGRAFSASEPAVEVAHV